MLIRKGSANTTMKKKDTVTIHVVLWFSVAALVAYYVTTPTRYDVFADEDLNNWSYKGKSILVVVPVLTANAYSHPGFYDYYNGTCGEECLTITINQHPIFIYESSRNSIELFKRLGATMISDYDLDAVPDMIFKYDKLILLHQEYATQKMFDAIQKHPNVIYLYPNALHAKIKVAEGKMTLLEGHGYKGKDNGFGWEYDNTRPDEFDDFCVPYHWDIIPNGKQLDCYPDAYILKHPLMLKEIRDL